MINSRVNFLLKIPIRCWDINKTRQGITFICRTLYMSLVGNAYQHTVNCSLESVWYNIILSLLLRSLLTCELPFTGQILFLMTWFGVVWSATICWWRLSFFGHLFHADTSQDHSRALQACIRSHRKDWLCRTGRPRQTWLRTLEDDLCLLNFGLASTLEGVLYSVTCCFTDPPFYGHFTT